MHSDSHNNVAQLPLFVRKCVFLKVNLSSEIDQIYEMHKPFHSCCLTNSLIVAKLIVEIKE